MLLRVIMCIIFKTLFNHQNKTFFANSKYAERSRSVANCKHLSNVKDLQTM